jgi:hydroxyacylglutathione hydrolase
MVGDMGRTELASSVAEGAATLFESAERLRSLPDYLEAFPGASSGSVCGRGLSGHPSSTVGFGRWHNRAFRITDRAEFLRLMRENLPLRPPKAEEIRARNLGREPASV